ncbi:MAG: serpin family protein, partial [Capsulimonadaceae bacterium]
ASMTACGQHSLDPPERLSFEDTLVAAGTVPFGLTMLDKLVKSSPGANILISPLSLSDGLVLAYTGAAGQTQSEIGNVLGVAGKTPDSVEQGYADLTNWVTGIDPGTQVDVANGVWVRQGVSLNWDYGSRCGRLGATDRTLNFNDPSAAQTINGWVSDATRSNITHLVSPEDLGQPDSAAVLTNAVYFHGTWTNRFDTSATHSQAFTMDGGVRKQVQMMTAAATYSYGQSDAWQSIALPYGNGSFAMLVVLPAAGHSVDDLVARMTPGAWNALTHQMQPSKVNLSMPRFKMSYTNETLAQPLADMGMPSAFGSSANFSLMSPTDLYIGKVAHETMIEVNEEGTVAAASTGIEMRVKAGMERANPVMVVDHPFLFAITDSATGALLFVGIVNDPQ